MLNGKLFFWSTKASLAERSLSYPQLHISSIINLTTKSSNSLAPLYLQKSIETIGIARILSGGAPFFRKKVDALFSRHPQKAVENY